MHNYISYEKNKMRGTICLHQINYRKFQLKQGRLQCLIDYF